MLIDLSRKPILLVIKKLHVISNSILIQLNLTRQACEYFNKSMKHKSWNYILYADFKNLPLNPHFQCTEKKKAPFM